MQQLFAFGRDLQLLPQRHVAEVDGAVPLYGHAFFSFFFCEMCASHLDAECFAFGFRFLVEVCEYLSQHVHTEGIFRKTGSLGRIRALRVKRHKHSTYINSHQ